jgi:hypothetical protein
MNPDNTTDNIIVKKKRGRKPKSLNTIIKPSIHSIIEDEIPSEEEQLILHLPITINNINNMSDESNDYDESQLFIKSDGKINCESEVESDTINTISKSNLLSINNNINSNINKMVTHTINVTSNTKCWWCRNKFTVPAIQLPEDYYNETFYCIGHFCSFSCVKSYNLDLNDMMIWKRESLINLLYFMTYNEYKDIPNAPHWLALQEYGGMLSIDEFRKNSVENSKDYVVLHPPLISRQMQIEESYKVNKLKEVSIDKLNKMYYSEAGSDYAMKRSKPIQSSQLNLETTMGLIKMKKK